jgi:glutamate--cysteine ligase catalytic subunit
MSCFNLVEYNMRMRHAIASALLSKNESLLTISFPALGTMDFTDPSSKPTPSDPTGAGRSIFFPDEGIYSGHPRFSFH